MKGMFNLEQLDSINCKAMMGGFLLYYNDIKNSNLKEGEY